LAFLLLAAVTLAQHTTGKDSARLYLVSGTPNKHGPDSYPVTLYSVDDEKKLDSVREVVRQEDGVHSAYAYGDAIFFLYPHTVPTSVAILHTDDPNYTDNVVFSSTGLMGAYGALGEPPGIGLELLISWLATPIEPGTPIPAHPDVAQAAISSRSITGRKRSQFNDWADYGYLRFQGEPGGPSPSTAQQAVAQGGRLTLRHFDHAAAVDGLPPVQKNLLAGTPLFIVAATDQYLLFCTTRTASDSDVESGNLGSSMKIYVHDRTSNRWGTIQAEGNSPTLRLFDHWLAEIVANWSPNHGPNPGRENERTWDEKTDRLPPVQRLYEQFGRQEYARPGILGLQNLADGRKIRIETDQEDSEILWAADNSVLYRVNDGIYQAKIVGDKLRDATLIVKDEDVPEVHWVFWSK
jgi:hypothetical protein